MEEKKLQELTPDLMEKVNGGGPVLPYVKNRCQFHPSGPYAGDHQWSNYECIYCGLRKERTAGK